MKFCGKGTVQWHILFCDVLFLKLDGLYACIMHNMANAYKGMQGVKRKAKDLNRFDRNLETHISPGAHVQSESMAIARTLRRPSQKCLVSVVRPTVC